MNRNLHALYCPVPTGSGFRAVPTHHGHMLWQSNQIGQPMLPMEMGGGIDWSSVWGKFKDLARDKALPLLEQHGPAVAAKVIELGMQRLGLGVGDEVFSEVGTAMRTRKRRPVKI